MTFVSLSVIDKYGRKALLIISFLIMAICFGGLSGFYLIKTENPQLATKLNWLPLLCVAVYISAFSIGCGPVPWVLMGEIYSSEVSIGFIVFFFLLLINCFKFSRADEICDEHYLFILVM